MRLGIHVHNDSGCAVANSMMAVEAGACHVQGTFMGIGERCGNADLSIIIPNLQLKRGLPVHRRKQLDALSETELRITDIANMTVPNNKPYVGESAFRPQGRQCISTAWEKLARSFEHIDPALVGNRRKFLLSEVSGKEGGAPEGGKDIAPELTEGQPRNGD